MQLDWQPFVQKSSNSYQRKRLATPRDFQLTRVVPQKPYWLQQVFNGHVFPGGWEYWPHSAWALQLEMQPVPQYVGP
jgi:hypothetical protein